MSTSRRARKSSAGYDLTRLIIGAEGTLGVITEMTLKLHGIPEAISAGVCRFPSIQACCDAAIMAIQIGVPIARVELLDEMQVRVCNVYSKLAMPEQPTLFLEFHGTQSSVAEQSERFGDIARQFGGGPFDWSKQAGGRTRLWQMRHQARNDVNGTAGRKADEDAHRPHRISLCCRDPRSDRKCSSARCQRRKSPAGKCHDGPSVSLACHFVGRKRIYCCTQIRGKRVDFQSGSKRNNAVAQ
jgi:hypothetical protein